MSRLKKCGAPVPEEQGAGADYQDEVGTVLRMITDLPPEARKWIVACEPDDE